MSTDRRLMVEFIVRTDGLREAFARVVQAVADAAPALLRLHRLQQRHQVRTVTRRKQRGKW